MFNLSLPPGHVLHIRVAPDETPSVHLSLTNGGESLPISVRIQPSAIPDIAALQALVNEMLDEPTPEPGLRLV